MNKSIAKKQQAIEKPNGSLARRKNDSAINTFKKLIQADEQQSEAIIEKITDAAIAAGIAEDLGVGAEKTTRYVVNMTDEMKNAIDRGIIKLDRGKDGQLLRPDQGCRQPLRQEAIHQRRTLRSGRRHT